MIIYIYIPENRLNITVVCMIIYTFMHLIPWLKNAQDRWDEIGDIPKLIYNKHFKFNAK